MHLQDIFDVETKHGAGVFWEADIDVYSEFLVQVLVVDDQVTPQLRIEMTQHSHGDQHGQHPYGDYRNASTRHCALTKLAGNSLVKIDRFQALP